MKLISIHRGAGILVLLFILVHLTNHLLIYAGEELHIQFMDQLRVVYRHPIAEFILLSCCLIQIISGVGLLKRYNFRSIRSRVKKLQVASGIYIGIFLTLHISAVLIGRTMIDTNLYFGAAVVATFPLYIFFIPYYFLGVLSVFTHIGCGLYFQFKNFPALIWLMVIGSMIAILIIIKMSGVDIPLANLEIYNL